MADEPKRHRIEVACPECGNLQQEPALVISTQCRACRHHFRVFDGKGEVKTQTRARFAKPSAETDLPPPPAAPTWKLTSRSEPGMPPPRSFLKRLLLPSKPPREVDCFGCGHVFKALGEAQSSQCPKCGGYISLLDHDIQDAWNRRIETRGDVVIGKKGSISGTAVRCKNLTVRGKLSGEIECSGILTIRSSGRIVGTVRCKHLRVDRGAQVEFLQPVHTDTASIAGIVRGQIFCSGALTLEKRARLQGLVRTSSLIVKPGAKHEGSIEMIQPSSAS